MEQLQDIDLRIGETFTALGDRLRAAGSSSPDEHVRAEIESTLRQFGEVATPLWLETASQVSGILHVTSANGDDDGALDDATRTEMQVIGGLALAALGSALEDDSAVPQLQAVRDRIADRWGDILRALGTTLADEQVGEIQLDPSETMDPAPLDAGQLNLILSAMRAPANSAPSQEDPTVELKQAAAPTRSAKPSPITDAFTPSAAAGSTKGPTGPPRPPEPEQVTLDEGLLEAFMEDANQCLATMERLVLDGQATSAVQLSESSRLVRRELHTLKGASASVEMSSLAAYLHAVEEWLEAPGQINGAGELRNIVLECVDTVRRHVGALGGSAASALDTHVPASTPAAVSPSTPAPGTPPAAQPALAIQGSGSVASDSHDASEATLRVKTSQVDRLMDLLAQLAMLRSRRDGRSNEFQSGTHQLGRSINRLRSTTEDVSFVGGNNRVQGENEAASLRLKLSEIANDLEQSLLNLRRLQEPLDDENRSISHFIGEFRQELVQLRRMPLAGLFRRLQRAAFDAARAEGKEVRFELHGDHAGLERSLQERLYEPLLHMVRNAVSHGIEAWSDRVKVGKDPVGTVTLEASGSSHVLVLELTDDGAGLNYEAIRRRGLQRGLIAADRPVSNDELARLIFHPGFSTAEVTTGVSGRGVGMDIVASTLERLHCLLEIDSEPGRGTRFRMTLPLFSIIEHVMVFRACGRLFGVPMTFVKSAVESRSKSADGMVATHSPEGDAPLKVIEASDVLQLGGILREGEGRQLVLGPQRRLSRKRAVKIGQNAVDTSMPDIVLTVDEILGPEEIVVRPLPTMLKHHPFLSGVTVSGRGEILQLLDCHRLIKRCQKGQQKEDSNTAGKRTAKPLGERQWKVLVTDDSISARRRLVDRLAPYGVQVTEAGDGSEALERLRDERFDMLFTDLEMERMNGFDLLAEIQLNSGLRPDLLVMITSRTEQEVRDRSRQLGAHACLPKPITEEALDAVLRTFLARQRSAST